MAGLLRAKTWQPPSLRDPVPFHSPVLESRHANKCEERTPVYPSDSASNVYKSYRRQPSLSLRTPSDLGYDDYTPRAGPSRKPFEPSRQHRPDLRNTFEDEDTTSIFEESAETFPEEDYEETFFEERPERPFSEPLRSPEANSKTFLRAPDFADMAYSSPAMWTSLYEGSLLTIHTNLSSPRIAYYRIRDALATLGIQFVTISRGLECVERAPASIFYPDAFEYEYSEVEFVVFVVEHSFTPCTIDIWKLGGGMRHYQRIAPDIFRALGNDCRVARWFDSGRMRWRMLYRDPSMN
jgi:hypothetical protein